MLRCSLFLKVFHQIGIFFCALDFESELAGSRGVCRRAAVATVGSPFDNKESLLTSLLIIASHDIDAMNNMANISARCRRRNCFEMFINFSFPRSGFTKQILSLEFVSA
mmetsp:Transcript_1551/g.1986  ORF Transcript_1551/g.1986 Transcript_1551/m.1986 type:complete len:109 (-) Transcript_1551:623-949(-)